MLRQALVLQSKKERNLEVNDDPKMSIPGGKKGRYRSFVRSSLIAMQLEPVVRLLVFLSY